ncbi:uncharacterized protein LOC106181064 [Lingula anatina]|uniref:Uncharacterized protein LOC106181064 n=1 Tax=Lingula anatina TaxID=7574 RepID=A0A1S3KDS4_LINAN|nr:uncharacterized protein LOC106181064 [Lingula anatina]|eukprot:XP_013420778.1 uncharacterized protein LOC106181064 [Lingula anatina]
MEAKSLRMITYLSPNVPVEVFETIMQYLEEKLEREAYLIYESRWSGPPRSRTDPFTKDEADVGFICSPSFLRLQDRKNKYIEHIPVAPVFVHPKGENRPVYFSDVIIHSDNKSSIKEFHDLKGRRLGYSDSESLSGNFIVLSQLKKMGTNTSFFASTFCSGSHLNSIRMVLDRVVDVAAIDSNCLRAFLKKNPELRSSIHILTTWGPMSVYPMVVNARLPEELKSRIAEVMLTMHEDPRWQPKLQELDIIKFVPIDTSLYNFERELLKDVEKLSIDTPYY